MNLYFRFHIEGVRDPKVNTQYTWESWKRKKKLKKKKEKKGIKEFLINLEYIFRFHFLFLHYLSLVLISFSSENKEKRKKKKPFLSRSLHDRITIFFELYDFGVKGWEIVSGLCLFWLKGDGCAWILCHRCQITVRSRAMLCRINPLITSKVVWIFGVVF